MPITLTVSTSSLNLMAADCKQILANHHMQSISFASGGDPVSGGAEQRCWETSKGRGLGGPSPEKQACWGARDFRGVVSEAGLSDRAKCLF